MAAKAGVRLNGPALKEIRRARQLTVTGAAHSAGVTQGTWSNWEAGRRQVSFEHLGNIREVLLIEDIRSILWPVEGAEVREVAESAA